jgi:myo-inositol-1(or 4)-monophosphatase
LPVIETDLAADLALLTEAAHAAGAIARARIGQVKVWDKPDGEGPVTEADLEIDALLRRLLTGARPGHGWLSEESADAPDRLAADRVFVVDPIDGTRAFAAGEPTFSHSLALVEAGRVVAAVVHLPMLDRIYAAVRGGGAMLNGEPIHASRRVELEDATVLMPSAQLRPEFWPGGVPNLRRFFRPSIAYRLCLAASGRFDAMLTLRDAWEWDVAAGVLIAEEAGATVTDRTGGEPAFNRAAPRLLGVIAAGPDLHAALLARVRPAA